MLGSVDKQCVFTNGNFLFYEAVGSLSSFGYLGDPTTANACDRISVDCFHQ